MPSAACPMCEILVEVDASGACSRCGAIIEAALARPDVSLSFRAPAKPEGAGRREVTSSRFVDVDRMPDAPSRASSERTPPPPEPDRTSRPDWAKPSRVTGSSSVAVDAGSWTALVWVAGAALALIAGFALSYLLT